MACEDTGKPLPFLDKALSWNLIVVLALAPFLLVFDRKIPRRNNRVSGKRFRNSLATARIPCATSLDEVSIPRSHFMFPLSLWVTMKLLVPQSRTPTRSSLHLANSRSTLGNEWRAMLQFVRTSDSIMLFLFL